MMEIDIKTHLDALVSKYNTPGFVEKDPIQFPRRYSSYQDIEIVYFLVDTNSWGNREAILKYA